MQLDFGVDGYRYEQLLRKSFDMLSENGVLILSIINKFGIKYFSGCREDHLNHLLSELRLSR